MNLSIYIGFLAATLQIVGYILYWKGIRKGLIQSNPVSWFIWAYGSLISLGTYSQMTNDWVKDILPLGCSVACIILCFQVFRFSDRGTFDRYDYMIICIDLAVTVAWFFVGATIANLLDQFGTLISFVPLVYGLLSGKNKELPTPWLIWSLAYLCQIAVVLARYEKWEDLAFPVVCFFTHSTVYLLSLKRP